MARADLTIIEVHDAVLFAPGGDVNEWCHGIARDLKRRARLYAPPNHSESRYQRTSTGHMLSTIDADVFEMTDDTLMIELSVGTDYAQYVLGGTAGQGTRYIYRNYGNKAVIDRVMRRQNWRKYTWENPNVTRGMWMRLRGGGISVAKSNYALRVRGQRANPFTLDAYNRTRLEHSALPRLIGVPAAIQIPR